MTRTWSLFLFAVGVYVGCYLIPGVLANTP